MVIKVKGINRPGLSRDIYRSLASNSLSRYSCMHDFVHMYCEMDSNRCVFKHRKSDDEMYKYLRKAYQRVGQSYEGRDVFISHCQLAVSMKE